MTELIKPEPSEAVAEFLGAWEHYQTAVRDFRTGSLSTYGKSYLDIIASNESIMDELDKAVADIRGWANGLMFLGEDIAEQAAAFKSAEYEYQRALKEEADKPRRDWDEAKDAMSRTLEKEKRSLAIRIGRLANKRWSVSAGEKELIEAQIELMRARESVVEAVLSDLHWMRYSDHEGTEFSAELVAKSAEFRKQRINELIAQFDAERLIEAGDIAE